MNSFNINNNIKAINYSFIEINIFYYILTSKIVLFEN